MKSIILFLFMLSLPRIYAQNHDYSNLTDSSQKGVEKSIRQFFQAMLDSDSAAMRYGLHPDIKLVTTFADKKGAYHLLTDSIAPFLEAVGTPKAERWQESINNLKIEVDLPLAHAWMDYTFYLDSTLSHCGVNAMQLFWDGERWLIFQIADTRHKCLDSISGPDSKTESK